MSLKMENTLWFLINSKIADIRFLVDVKINFACVLTLNSGVGKTYYSSLLCKLLQSGGKDTYHIKYSNINELSNFVNANKKVYLLVLDDYELYADMFSINDIKSISENVWIISKLHTSFEMSYDCIEYSYERGTVKIESVDNPF